MKKSSNCTTYVLNLWCSNIVFAVSNGDITLNSVIIDHKVVLDGL